MPYPFRILLILIFFVFKLDAEVVSAQIPVVEGYLVTNDRDTIRGKFEYVSKSLFENKLVFIKGTRAAISVFRPAEIRGLFSSGIAFESKNVEGKRMFLRALSRGRVNCPDLLKTYLFGVWILKGTVRFLNIGEPAFDDGNVK